MAELIDMVFSFSTLDPTQVVLALDDTLTSFQSFTQIVTVSTTHITALLSSNLYLVQNN